MHQSGRPVWGWRETLALPRPQKIIRPAHTPLKSDFYNKIVPKRTHAVQQFCRYSITSSAVESTPAGMVRPSALAVLRLINNSNLVGRSTGKSAGFAPFRIRST